MVDGQGVKGATLMAELLQLNVQERTKTDKGHNRRLRLKDMVPGIYYDQKGANIAVQVKLVPLQKAYAKVGNAKVFELVLEREGKTETLRRITRKYVQKRNQPVDIEDMAGSESLLTESTEAA